ncbi:MAG TPA: serine hydrolase [Thermomicrobiaceae bacterium]|nr:serine hydrolase [Thermomicrobiaceae bacterium]
MATTGTDTRARIATVAEELSGTIGVAARGLTTGEEILFNADTVFPTASTMKLMFLYELYRQVDRGEVDPTRRIRWEDRLRVPGSGVLQDLAAGCELTVKDYATLMITVSDNAATDVIYDLIGRPQVAAAIRDLGLSSTYLPLDTRELLAGLRDLDPADPELTYEKLNAALGASPSTFDCAALRETPDNNVSTPRDLARLSEAIERGQGLSPASREAAIDILKRQKFNSIIPELLPFGVKAAHKTGSLRGVRNDAGIVYAGDTTYVIALMSKGFDDEISAVRALAGISKLVYQHFAGDGTAP